MKDKNIIIILCVKLVNSNIYRSQILSFHNNIQILLFCKKKF
jgi:hypothetical protein